MNLIDIGKIIKQLRIQLGLTQSQLAEKINVSYQQIQKYEKGKSEIGILRFVAIAKALEIAPNEFINKLAANQVAEPEQQYQSDKNQHLMVTANEKKLVAYFRVIANTQVKDNIIKLLKSLSEINTQ